MGGASEGLRWNGSKFGYGSIGGSGYRRIGWKELDGEESHVPHRRSRSILNRIVEDYVDGEQETEKLNETETEQEKKNERRHIEDVRELGIGVEVEVEVDDEAETLVDNEENEDEENGLGVDGDGEGFLLRHFFI